MVDDYCQNLGFANTAIGFVEQLKSWLTDTAKCVDEGYPDNRQVVINEQGEPVLKRPPKHQPSLTATWRCSVTLFPVGRGKLSTSLRAY